MQYVIGEDRSVSAILSLIRTLFCRVRLSILRFRYRGLEFFLYLDHFNFLLMMMKSIYQHIVTCAVFDVYLRC